MEEISDTEGGKEKANGKEPKHRYTTRSLSNDSDGISPPPPPFFPPSPFSHLFFPLFLLFCYQDFFLIFIVDFKRSSGENHTKAPKKKQHRPTKKKAAPRSTRKGKSNKNDQLDDVITVVSILSLSPFFGQAYKQKKKPSRVSHVVLFFVEQIRYGGCHIVSVSFTFFFFFFKINIFYL